MVLLLYFGVMLLAFAAYFFKKLTKAGALAALIVGSLITFGLGIQGLLLLALFFMSSTFWSSYQQERKETEVTPKDGCRNEWQVLANGGVAAACAALYGFFPIDLWLFAFIASLAAANADTWASELGALSKTRPLHIASRKRVEQGTSGAVTALGMLAALGGSLFLSGAAFLFWQPVVSVFLVGLLTLAGFIGNLVDTVIGAYYQVVYRCEQCGIKTEREQHCGRATKQVHGKSWLGNNAVNFSCTLSGALIGIGIGMLV